MSFRELSLSQASFNQFKYKLEANKTMFLTLFVLQIIFLIFAVGGTGTYMNFVSNIKVMKKIYSADGVIIMSMVWSAIAGLGIVSLRDMDFSLVSNRLSGHLSNWMLLGGMAVYAGLAAALMGPFMRLAAYLYYGSQVLTDLNFLISPGEFLMSFLVITLYNILFMAATYTYGMLGQRYKAMYYIMPAIFIGLFYLELSVYGRFSPLGDLITFYLGEANLLIFIVKGVLSTAGLLVLSIWLGKRLEVRL